MSFRSLIAAVLAAALTAGCGSITVQPKSGSRGQIDNQETMHPNHLACLLGAHLPVTVINGHTLQIGAPPSGPTIVFTPTPSSAQDAQIYGHAQGAEAIGSALLWVHQGSDGELQKIEDCLAVGVQE